MTQYTIDDLDPSPPVARNFTDLAGKKFGRLTVIKYAGKRNVPDRTKRNGAVNLYWLCQCDCGKSCIVTRAVLTKGSTKSCGCLNIDTIVARNTTHGMIGTLTHNSWRAMMDRCYKPKSASYHNYGARGIRVYEQWHVFEKFLADMGERPTANHSLERTNNDKDYSPDNCKWATKKQQARNTKRNVVVEYQGQEYIFADLALLVGIPYGTLRSRIECGKTIDEAIAMGKSKRKPRKPSHALKSSFSEAGA